MSCGSFSNRDSSPRSSGQATNNKYLLGHTEAKYPKSRPSRIESFELTTPSGYTGNTVCRLLDFSLCYGYIGIRKTWNHDKIDLLDD